MLSSPGCTGDSIYKDIARVSLLLTDIELLLVLQLLPSNKLDKIYWEVETAIDDKEEIYMDTCEPTLASLYTISHTV